MPEKSPPPPAITNALAALERLRAENPAADYTDLAKALPPLATKLALHNLDISVDTLLDHASKGADQVRMQYAALGGIQKNKTQKSYEEIVEALHDKAGVYNYKRAKHPEKTFLSRLTDQKDVMAKSILKTLRANTEQGALNKALTQAARDDNVSLIDKLVVLGANNFFNALEYALAYGRRDATMTLIKHGDISVKKALEQYEFMLMMQHDLSAVCIPAIHRENKLILLDLKHAHAEFDLDQGTRVMKVTALWDKIYNPRHIPDALTYFNPYFIKMSCLSSLYEKIYLEMSDNHHSFVALEDILNGYEYNRSTAEVAIHLAARGTTLFQTEDRVMRYLETWGKSGKQPLHDILQTAPIPAIIPGNIPDFKSWGDAALQHGPMMARLAQYADTLRTPLKNEHGTCWSLSKTRAEIAKMKYPNGYKNPFLASLAMRFQWHAEKFDRALEVIDTYENTYASTDHKKPGAAIPEITIPGTAFGKDDYTFSRLPDGDLRALLLGEFTDCCQHIGGSGAACAKHGFLSPHSGFYILTHNTTHDIVAQSWVWRGKKGELVMDSLEALSGHMNDEQWERLCDLFAEEASKSGIQTIHVGTGGNTPKALGGFNKTANPATPVDYNGYRDSESQYVVKTSYQP